MRQVTHEWFLWTAINILPDTIPTLSVSEEKLIPCRSIENKPINIDYLLVLFKVEAELGQQRLYVSTYTSWI